MFETAAIKGLLTNFQGRSGIMNTSNLLVNKILYVDDEYVNYLYLSELLAETNTEINRAYSEEQTKYWIELIPDLSLIIVSSHFLEYNSFNFITKVKELNANIAVIVIMENQDSELAQKCLAWGCDLHVSRHIDSYDLIESINDVIQSNPINLNNALKHSDI